MPLRHLLRAAAAILLTATPASAQQPWTIDLGAFGRLSRFDASLPFDNPRFGAGGRLGLFFWSNFAVEGEGSYTASGVPGASVNAIPVRLRLAYHVPVAEGAAAIIGAGWVHNWYRGGVTESDNGLTGLVGLRFAMAQRLYFRADGTLDYVERPFNRAVVDRNINYGAQAGIGLLLGRADARRHDSDRDGVADAFDACPRTPAGEKVSSTGCVADGDKDSVPDAVDRCPGSPAGEPVDSHGCTVVLEADRDGVPDATDKCKGTPPGAAVDSSGCLVDEDGDGVVNSRDRCAGTSPGTVVDGTGCAIPKDSDRDGVPDGIDKCPASEPGAKVDATGCVPPKDTDGDGISDATDACPATPPRATVDAAGCPPLFVGSTAVVLEGVTFNPGKATLLPEAKPMLERVARALLAAPKIKVEVAGHTDDVGNPASNLILSQRRADAVRFRLIQLGVPPDQLTARGYGAEVPLVPNTTRAGRAANRRVEVKQVP